YMNLVLKVMSHLLDQAISHNSFNFAFYLEKLKAQRGQFYLIDTDTPPVALLMDTARPFEILSSSSSSSSSLDLVFSIIIIIIFFFF
ncbi:MAG: hypothetical protein WA941_15715, partial [Nitrososphaeraceae archaeon]